MRKRRLWRHCHPGSFLSNGRESFNKAKQHRPFGAGPRYARPLLAALCIKEKLELSYGLSGFDFSGFWEESEYADEKYTSSPVTASVVSNVEKKLGFKLPSAYIELAKIRNGGCPKLTCHRTNEEASWAGDHIAINGIYSIGYDKTYSLCGDGFNSQFWQDEWGYPEIGIYFADCPSAGHDMLALDYRDCGPQGEPKVVHVDQECDYKITLVANDFSSFIRGLQDENAFEG